MSSRLTPIQADVLAAIQRRLDGGEPSPTYRDLCAEFGWASTGTARDHLRALQRKGFVELPGGRGHRQIRLRRESSPASRIPLLGQVVAGAPITAEEQVEARIPVPGEWIDRHEHFALHVSGDSMKDAGILDGDCVVVRHQSTAQDGEIVVATLDGETTLKRLRLRGKRATLVAENPRYTPIEVRTATAMIHGVVVGLLREYGSPRSKRGATRRRKTGRHST